MRIRRMNCKPLLRKLKSAAPVILSALSVVGVAATAVLTAKATVKALEAAETRNDAWKCYVPAALTAIATAACIIGNGILNRKQQASLLSAYALLENSYRQYRHKAKELYGADVDRKILSAVAVERSDPDNVITTCGLIGDTSLDWGTDAEETQHLFYEPIGGRYFTSTISRVLQAEIVVNHNIAVGGFVSVNDFYEFLGIELLPGPEYNLIGWTLCDYYYFVEFDHYKAKLEDAPNGLEALVIDCLYHPEPEDELL